MDEEEKKEISILDFYPKIQLLEYKENSWQDKVKKKVEDYLLDLFIIEKL